MLIGAMVLIPGKQTHTLYLKAASTTKSETKQCKRCDVSDW